MSKLLFFLSILFIFSTCYSPSGEVYVDVPDAEPIEFSEGNFSQLDTLYVRGDLSMNFSLPQFEEILSYEIYIDTTSIVSGEGRPSELNYNSNQINDGYHVITLLILVPSQRNSLAANIGAEYQYTSISRIILVDNKPVKPIAFKEFTIVDSVLQINWKPYTDTLFNKLVVYDSEGIRFAEFYNPNDTSLLVPDYFSSSLDYSFKLHAKTDIVSSTTSYNFKYNLKLDTLKDNQIQLSCDSLPFKALKSMGIIVQDLYSSENIKFVYDVKNPDPFIITIGEAQPYIYGKATGYINGDPGTLYSNNLVDKVSIDLNLRSSRLESSTSPYFREYIDDEVFDDYLYDDPFFSIKRGKIILHSDQPYDEYMELASIENIVFSPDRKGIFQISGSVINQISPIDFSIIDSYDFMDMVTSPDVDINQICASSNSLLAISYSPIGSNGYYNSNEFMVLDWAKKSIYSELGDFNSIDGWLTPDASKIYFYAPIGNPYTGYSIGYILNDPYNEKIHESITLADGNKIYGAFRYMFEDEKLLVLKSSSYLIVDYNLNSILSTTQLTFNDAYLYYDRIKTVYEFKDSSLFYYNTDTGELTIDPVKIRKYARNFFVDEKYVWIGDYFIKR